MFDKTISSEYDAFKKEIYETCQYVHKSIIPGTREWDLYKGTFVLYSGLIYNPDFMFIGINPGDGYCSGNNNKRSLDIEPGDGFEYINAYEEDYDYTLAKQTREVFAKTKYMDRLPNSVKTNMFYVSTASQKDLTQLVNILRAKHSVDLFKESSLWTKRLIGLFNPKIIICEGKLVADLLSIYFNIEPEWISGITSFQIENRIQVLGYKRNRSIILNKAHLINSLNMLEI